MRLILLTVLALPLYPAVPRFWFEPAAGSRGEFVARGRSGLFTFAEGEVGLQLGREHPVQIAFPGARPGVRPEGGALLPGKTNYFLGPADHWRVAVQQYREVRYRSLYPGVDLVFHATGADMEYDFILAPGADVSRIDLQFRGAKSIEVDAEGDLLIGLRGGKVRQRVPVAFQMHGKERLVRKARYKMIGRDAVRFVIDDYDPSRELTIDPVLVFQTYVAGSRTDLPAGIGVDRAGNTYIAGTTNSIDFPRVGRVQNPIGGATLLASFDGGLTYTRPDLGAPVFGLAGVAGHPDTVYAATSNGVYRSENDGRSWVAANAGIEGFTVNSVATDPHIEGRAYAATQQGLFRSDDAGRTWVEKRVDTLFDLPVPVSQLTVDSAQPQALYAVTLGRLKKSMDGGNTWAALPFKTTTNPYEPLPNDISLAIDPKNNNVIYAAVDYYNANNAILKSTDGGNTWKALVEIDTLVAAQSIAIDPANSSLVFAIARDGVYRSVDAGRTWINAGLQSLTLDGAVFDPNHAGVLYVVADEGLQVSRDGGTTFQSIGQPQRHDFRTAFFTTSALPALLVGGDPDEDAFLVKWNAAGDQILYATYIGGSYPEFASALAVDADGNAYLTGTTQSNDFPVTAGATQSKERGEVSAFVTKLNPEGTLLYSTLLGGSGTTQSNAIALDTAGNAYIAGFTADAGFPVTARAMQGRISENCSSSVASKGDAFAAKVNTSGALAYSTFLGGTCSDSGYGITVDPDGNAVVVGTTYSKDFPVTRDALGAGFAAIPGRVKGATSGFLVKLNAAGTGALYSTLMGGGYRDAGTAVTLDRAGNVIVAGTTFGFDDPGRAIAYCNSLYFGFGQAFVDPQAANLFLMKLKLGDARPSLLRVMDSCSLKPTSVALDAHGNIWMAGGYGGFPTGPPSFVALSVVQTGVRPTADMQPVDKSKPYGIPLVAPLAAVGSGFAIEFAPDGQTIPFSTYLAQRVFVAVDQGSGVHLAVGARGGETKKEHSFGGESTFFLKLESAAVYPITIQPPVGLGNLTLNGSDLSIGAGEVVEITGQGIGPATMVSAAFDSSGILPKTLAGVTVTFAGTAAPLLSVRANRIVCVVPFAVLSYKYRDGVSVKVRYNQLESNPIQVGVYSGVKDAISAVLNSDGTANSQTNPARPGEIITLYGSSFGQTVPASEDGRINRTALPLVANVSISIQGILAQVLFAGAAVGQVAGVAQVNFVVPRSVSQSEQANLYGNGGGLYFPLWVSPAPK